MNAVEAYLYVANTNSVSDSSDFTTSLMPKTAFECFIFSAMRRSMQE